MSVCTKEELFQKGAFAQARVMFEEDKDANIRHKNLSNAALCCLKMHESIDALDLALQTIQQRASWWRGYHRAAAACHALGRYKRAATYAKHMVEAPERPETSAQEAEHALLLKQVQDSVGDPLGDVSETDDPEEVKFHEWLRSLGAQYRTSIHFRKYAAGYRGCHASRNISNGQIIVQIPRSAILTVQAAASQSDFLLKLSKAMVTRHDVLACALLEDPPKWRPYILMLPKSYKDMPSQWSVEDKKDWLAGTQTLLHANNHLAGFTEGYKRVQAVDTAAWKCSFEQYTWARMAVSTRVFSFRVKGDLIHGLVPVADMLNHHPNPNTTWRFEDKLDSFILVATRAIAAGEEVFDSYGKKCNSKLLSDYGFALDPTKYPTEANEALFAVSEKVTVPLRTDMKSEATLSSLELVRTLVKSTESKAPTPLGTSRQLELEVLKRLAEAAGGALSNYRAEAFEMPEEKLTYWQRFARYVMMSERQIYQTYIQLYDYVLKEGVPASDSALKKRHRNKTDMISVYMNDIWLPAK